VVRPEAAGRLACGLAVSCALMACRLSLAQNSVSPIPYREDGAGLSQQAMTTAGVVLILLALAVAGLLALRRKLGARLADSNSSGLHCAASTRLSAQTRVHVLAYRGREYLLAQCGDSLVRIAELEPFPPAPENEP
jgi:hypothetical protein